MFVNRYNNKIYNNYYYIPKLNMLLKSKSGRFHIIKPSLIGNMEVITLRDTERKQHTISFKKFIKEYTL